MTPFAPREVGARELDIIDKDKRAGIGTEGGDASYEEVGIVLAWLAASLICDHTGDIARKRGRKVAGRHLQCSDINGGDGTDDAFLFLFTEGYDGGSFQLVGHVLQFYHDVFPVPHFDHLCLFSHELYLEFVRRFHTADFEGTV